MPLPSNPTNNQIADLNGSYFQWNSASGTWNKLSSGVNGTTGDGLQAANITAGGTIAAANVTTTGTVTASNISASNISITSGSIGGFSLGYLEIPQNTQSTNYVLQLSDRSKQIYHTISSNSSIFIPTNTNVPFPIGTAVSIILNGAGNTTVVANTGVRLYLAGNLTGFTGTNTRVISSYGLSTLIKTETNTWYITGAGVT